MAFSGWPEEALDFYEGLEADNTKTYWTRRKAVYEEKVLRPMMELLDELGPEFGESKIFRPYRDVRFSKDKTPYKTHLGAMLGGGYIQLSAQGLAAGDGMYGMASDQVGRYREAVAADRTGGELEQVITGIEKQGIEVHGRDVLKTVPRGYPADHPRAGLLRYKGIVAWREWPPEPWLETKAAKDRIAGFLRATRPLADVTLDRAPGRPVASGEPAARAVAGALAAGAGMLASEQLGVAERCLEMTIAYVKERRQFARPVGSFQALKHRLADVWVAITQARAAARYAAACLAAGDPDTPVAVALAKAACGEAAVLAAQECVQLHGGIGFTWEHPAHLLLKRAKSGSLALGTPDRHRAALAALVDLPPPPGG